MDDNKTARIRKLRLLLKIHSYLYYHRDTSLIPDSAFDKMSRELTELQSSPSYDPSALDCYNDEFVDWSISSAHALKPDERTVARAESLLRYGP